MTKTKTNNDYEKIAHIRTELHKQPFVPLRFFANKQLQILAFIAAPFFTTKHPKEIKKTITGADNNKIGITCWFHDDYDNHATVVILNGFEGYSTSGDSLFGKGYGHKAFYHGYNVIFLKQRGEGKTLHMTKSIGDFYVDDLPLTLKEIATWNRKSLYVIGISLGGWAATLAVGRLGKNVPSNFRGLVSISAPTSTKEAWTHVEQNAFYDWMLMRKYKSLIHRRIKVDPPGTWDMNALKNIKTKRQFFETYMHTFGYPDKFVTLDEYFEKTDTIPYIKTMAVPMLIINAQDDPVVPVAPFKATEVQKNPNVITLLPEYGSHGCFIGKKKYVHDLDRHWAQNRAFEYINAIEKG